MRFAPALRAPRLASFAPAPAQRAEGRGETSLASSSALGFASALVRGAIRPALRARGLLPLVTPPINASLTKRVFCIIAPRGVRGN